MPRAPVTFTNQGQQLIGVLHTPDRGPAPGVVFLHGFQGHRVGPHRIHVKAAAALAAAGMAALRFDCRGSGDSEGDFRDTTVTGQLDDARAALDWLAARPEVDPGRLGVVGYSLGGTLAALLAGADPRIGAAALWAPVARFDGPWEDQAMVAGLSGAIDLAGDLLGRAFYTDLFGHDPPGAVTWSAAAFLVVHGTADASVPVEHGRDLAEAAGARGRLHRVERADHNFGAAHWEQEVIATTVAWLREQLAGPRL